jgi:YVTN family beta-propeller protein
LVVRLQLAVQPDHLCFSPDNGQLFVTGEGMDTVVIVYPYLTEVAKTVLAGRTPGAMAVSRSADGEYLFVANTRSGDVTVLSIELQRVIATLTVGDEPGYIAVTPDNQYALVLNRRSGNMAVIRIAAIVAKRTRPAPLFTVIPVGARPVSLAVRLA